MTAGKPGITTVEPDAVSAAGLADDLRRAATLVEGLGLPDDLRAAAFGHAVTILSARRSTASVWPLAEAVDGGADVRLPPGTHPAEMVPSTRASTGATPSADTGDTDEAWGRMCSRSGINVDDWERLVSLRKGQVELTVSKARLPATARAATRDVVLLLGAARRGARQGEDTPLEDVRNELVRYGRLSSGHFREYVDALDDVINVARDGRTYRLLPDAWEALPATAARLLRRDAAAAAESSAEACPGAGRAAG